MTLLRTAVETAVREVHKLLHTGRGPNSLHFFCGGRMTVSSVFADWTPWTSYSSLFTNSQYSLFSLTALTRSLHALGLKPQTVIRLQEQNLMDEMLLMNLSDDAVGEIDCSISDEQLEILRKHRRDIRKCALLCSCVRLRCNCEELFCVHTAALASCVTSMLLVF